MISPYFAGFLYLATVIIGLFGNIWVVCSVARSRKPKSLMSRSSPSDRLRAYISVLAVIDLTVLMALLVRALYHFLPHFMLDSNSCRAMFVLENSVKITSLTVLSCISIERYITIRKPFCSEVYQVLPIHLISYQLKVRRQFVNATPIGASVFVGLVIGAIVVQINSVTVSTDGMNCVRSFRGKAFPRVASYLTAVAFLVDLTIISLNYSQIFIPDNSIQSELTGGIRLFNNFREFSFTRWIIFIATWLTSTNAAGDWIFYAVMNRDLRNLIRFATERRKRSTMSHAASPSTNRSLRQQVPPSMKVLHSISYRSSIGGSMDDAAGASFLQSSPKESTVSQEPNSPYGVRAKISILTRKESDGDMV
uniref:G_PROTEIN_RECEP_F1_2 domain-containing protein n=1 Tax=Caenorhabditis tropicalis TaxID=1561998 RepID=A0A1I7TVB8_9PELO